jgi:uncharacterized membrane protein
VVADLYLWLKAFHVMLAIVWVGGAIVLQVLAIRIVRADDARVLRTFAGQVEFVGSRIFAPASGLLLVLGVWMVVITPAWSFTQLWIVAALVMFAYSFVSGAFYLSPQSGRLKRMYEEHGDEAPGAPGLINRLFLASRIELVLLVLIVFDMVLKPGA